MPSGPTPSLTDEKTEAQGESNQQCGEDLGLLKLSLQVLSHQRKQLVKEISHRLKPQLQKSKQVGSLDSNHAAGPFTAPGDPAVCLWAKRFSSLNL